MSYSVSWTDENQTIVLQTYVGNLKIEDYYHAIDESAKLLQSVNHMVDLIMDVSEANTDMKGFLQAVYYANKKVPDNQRLVIVVEASRFMQSLGKIAETIAPKATKNVYFVDTVDEAHQIIEEYRRSMT